MENKPDERVYHRKYIGILTELNGFKYFVPMSSPKDKDYENGKIKKNNLTTIYMKISLFSSVPRTQKRHGCHR